MFSWTPRTKREIKEEPRHIGKRVKEELPERVKNERVKEEPCNALVLFDGKARLPERRAASTRVVAKKKKKRKTRPSAKRKAAANKLIALSPALQRVVGASELSAGSLVSRVWQAMKERGLQNPDNGREMILDSHFSTLLGYQKCSMLDLRSLLRPHMVFPADNTDTTRQRDEPPGVENERVKQEVKRERRAEGVKKQIKEEPRRTDTVNLDTSSSEIDVYSVGTSPSSSSTSVARREEYAQEDGPQRWNVQILDMSREAFKFFISDDELDGASADTLSAALVENDRHEGVVRRVEDGYEISFDGLRGNRKYDLYIWDYYQFQIPLRAVCDFTIAAAAEFCAFFDPPLGNEVRHRCIDSDGILSMTMEQLVEFGVDSETATRILEIIKKCR